MGDCPSHLLWSRFKVGDLSPDEAKKISVHAAACEACRALSLGMDENIAAFEQHAASRRACLADALKAEAAAGLRPVQGGSIGPGRRLLAVGSLFAAAAAALVMLMIGFNGPSGKPDENTVGFKGAFSMEVVARRGTEQFVVKDGARLREGDAVRFSVTAGRPGYLAVFSLEADGAVSYFYPDSAPSADPSAFRLETPGRHILPGSVILDDARGKERFVAVFSARPFDRNRVLSAAKEALLSGKPDVGSEFSVQSIVVEKGE